MTISWLDWPEVTVLISIVATCGAYWLENRRDERRAAELEKRVTALEAASQSENPRPQVYDILKKHGDEIAGMKKRLRALEKTSV